MIQIYQENVLTVRPFKNFCKEHEQFLEEFVEICAERTYLRLFKNFGEKHRKIFRRICRNLRRYSQAAFASTVVENKLISLIHYRIVDQQNTKNYKCYKKKLQCNVAQKRSCLRAKNIPTITSFLESLIRNLQEIPFL